MRTEAEIKAIQAYKQAVLDMLECVSPCATNAMFHDAVNNVILKRAELGNIDVNSLNIDWSKK